MPSLAKRPCRAPGCAALVVSGFCAQHLQPEAPRATTAERGYGAEHKKLRVQCFVRDGFRCVDCGWEPRGARLRRELEMELPAAKILEELRVAFANGKRHLHADHELPIELRPDLRLSLDNLRTRCNECHSRKTAREDGGFGRAYERKFSRENDAKSTSSGVDSGAISGSASTGSEVAQVVR